MTDTVKTLQSLLACAEVVVGSGYSSRKKISQLVCNDGFKVSMQASENHYCSPRNNKGPWSSVELGFPSKGDDLIMEYAEDPHRCRQTVYGWVPIHTVAELVDKHGGLKDGTY